MAVQMQPLPTIARTYDPSDITRAFAEFFEEHCHPLDPKYEKEILIEVHGADIDSPIVYTAPGALKSRFKGTIQTKVEHFASCLFARRFSAPPKEGEARHFVLAVIGPGEKLSVAENVFFTRQFLFSDLDDPEMPPNLFLHEREVEWPVVKEEDGSLFAPCCIPRAVFMKRMEAVDKEIKEEEVFEEWNRFWDRVTEEGIS